MKPRVIALIAVCIVLAACTGDVAETSTTAAPEEEPATTAAAEPTTTAAGEVSTTAAATEEDPLPHTARPPQPTRRWSRRHSVLWTRSRTSSWRPSPERVRISTRPPSTRRWSASPISRLECDTGTGGEVIMGYADGGGTQRSAR